MNMQFRRSGQRAERRRRVLMEETGTGDQQQTATTGHQRSASAQVARLRRYPSAALTARQPTLIALIPKRRWTCLVLTTLLLSGIAALEALYGHVALGHARISLELLPAIDLASRASMASWYGSSLLVAAAGFGILTYFIRRHRLDDYRGRYRMWYWVVPVLLGVAVDQVAELQETFRNAILIAARIPGYEDALLVWTAAIAVLGCGVAIRLALELRECRLAICSLATAVGLYGTVAAAQLDWIWSPGSVFRVMAISSLTLGAHLALMLSIGFYARYVYRDASGLIRRTGRKRRAKAKPAEEVAQPKASGTPAKRVIRKDPPHNRPVVESDTEQEATGPARVGRKKRHRSEPPAVAARTGNGTAKTRASAEVAEATEAMDESTQKLSKAERRQLRKQRRRERRQSA